MLLLGHPKAWFSAGTDPDGDTSWERSLPPSGPVFPGLVHFPAFPVWAPAPRLASGSWLVFVPGAQDPLLEKEGPSQGRSPWPC